MAKDKRIKAVKVRHRRIWVPVIGHIFALILVTALAVASLATFYLYTCYLSTQDGVIVYEKIARNYEAGDLGPYAESLPMFIIDADGNETILFDDDTCSHDGLPIMEFNLAGFDGRESAYTAYADTRLPNATPSGLGFVLFNPYDSNEEDFFDARDPDNSVGDTLVLPYWISRELKDGSTLFMQVNLDITYSDLYFIGAFYAIMGVIILLTFIFLMVISIVNARRENRLVKLLFADPISNDRNWLWFVSRGSKVLKKGTKRGARYAIVSLMFVKYRNYVLCHSIEDGEKMLRNVYSVLAASLTKGEIAAHSTEAKFPMLLRYTDRDELKSRLEDIIGKLQKIDDNHNHKFAFQVGVSLIGESENLIARRKHVRNFDFDKEYNNASAARMTLEESDESGVAFFDEELVEKQKWIDRVGELQDKALANEEFKVYYQPKYDPRTDKMKGAEALIRWDSPELGFVPPGKFIDIFEHTGFIINIDNYMLTHVARDQKRWYDMGLPCVPVSVNVSRAHFVESNLADQINKIVTDAGCPCNLIEIELTESAFFDDKNMMINTIRKLQEYGFEVSMDDFGSGYSSLNSLKDLPLNVLKLDAGFFSEVEEEGRGQIVVSEAIKLAKNLNMRTVAEGVEQREQVDFLADEGCDMIQGYYYAKPMPGEDFEARMKGEE